MSDYTIHEHSHRFAVWAAGRAYSRGGKGGGYTVLNAKKMLEAAGLRNIRSVEDLPDSTQIDFFVANLIQAVIDARPREYFQIIRKKGGKPSRKVKHDFICTYGRAQKLVNIYLKSKIVCGTGLHNDARIAKLHPPLDRQLLDSLDNLDSRQYEENMYKTFREKWKVARSMGTNWTDFDKSTYDAYMAAIKVLQGNRPLWAVEEHWMKNDFPY